MASLSVFQSDVLLGQTQSSDLGFNTNEVSVTWADGMSMGSALVDGVWATADTATDVNGVLIDPRAQQYGDETLTAGTAYTMVVAKRGCTINETYFNIDEDSSTTDTDVDNAIAAFEALGNKVTDKFSAEE